MPTRLLPAIGLVCLSAVVSAQDTSQRATAEVKAVNTITITSGEEIEFMVGAIEGQRAASSSLDFTTNDGNTYSITIASKPGGWSFSPAVPGSASGAYPVLRFGSSESTAGESSVVSAVLIDSVNAVGAGAEVVSGITSSTGTVDVVLEVQDGPGVVAGTYRAGLDYTFTAP